MAEPKTTRVSVPHPIPERLAELMADRFRALAEPTRLRLLDSLRGGEATVGELVEAIGSSQQNVSKHLGLMLREGLVDRRREGNRSYYSIADPAIFDLCEHVCGGLSRKAGAVEELLEPTPVAVAR